MTAITDEERRLYEQRDVQVASGMYALVIATVVAGIARVAAIAYYTNRDFRARRGRAGGVGAACSRSRTSSLQDQATELELQQEQLQAQAVELETQKEEIQTSADELAIAHGGRGSRQSREERLPRDDESRASHAAECDRGIRGPDGARRTWHGERGSA